MEIVINNKLKDFLQKNNFEKIHVIRGKKVGLSIFSKQSWLQAGRDLRAHLESKVAVDLLDALIKETKEINLKKQGFLRISIPANLVKWSCIESKVTCVCWSDRIDLYPSQRDLGTIKGNPVVVKAAVIKGER